MFCWVWMATGSTDFLGLRIIVMCHYVESLPRQHATASQWRRERGIASSSTGYHQTGIRGYMHERRIRGRPRRWLNGIKEDVKSVNVTIQQSTRTTRGRATSLRRSCPCWPLEHQRGNIIACYFLLKCKI